MNVNKQLTSTLWHIQIKPAPGHADRLAERIAVEAVESGLAGPWAIRARRGFLIEGAISETELGRAARDVLVDPVVEIYTIRPSRAGWDGPGTIVHVMPKPGVTDPEAESALALLRNLGYAVSNVRTIRTYRIEGPAASIPRLTWRVLANDAVELAVEGELPFDQLGGGQPYRFERIEVPIRALADRELLSLSRTGQLALGLAAARWGRIDHQTQRELDALERSDRHQQRMRHRQGPSLGR